MGLFSRNPRGHGRRAEGRAAEWLQRQGHAILGRNLHAGGGEIDLLTRVGDLLCVVEVRQRRAGLLAADRSVDAAKEARLWKAVQALRHREGWGPGVCIRGDLLLLDGAGEIVHLPGVLWRGGEDREVGAL